MIKDEKPSLESIKKTQDLTTRIKVAKNFLADNKVSLAEFQGLKNSFKKGDGDRIDGSGPGHRYYYRHTITKCFIDNQIPEINNWNKLKEALSSEDLNNQDSAYDLTDSMKVNFMIKFLNKNDKNELSEQESRSSIELINDLKNTNDFTNELQDTLKIKYIGEVIKDGRIKSFDELKKLQNDDLPLVDKKNGFYEKFFPGKLLKKMIVNNISEGNSSEGNSSEERLTYEDFKKKLEKNVDKSQHKELMLEYLLLCNPNDDKINEGLAYIDNLSKHQDVSAFDKSLFPKKYRHC